MKTHKIETTEDVWHVVISELCAARQHADNMRSEATDAGLKDRWDSRAKSLTQMADNLRAIRKAGCYSDDSEYWALRAPVAS